MGFKPYPKPYDGWGLKFHTYLLCSREGDVEESLGSPSDPSFLPVSWSISGKYLAGALEKTVNIWQVNGKSHVNTGNAFEYLLSPSNGFPSPWNSQFIHQLKIYAYYGLSQRGSAHFLTFLSWSFSWFSSCKLKIIFMYCKYSE